MAEQVHGNSERTAGLLLMGAAALALLIANSPLAYGYHALLATYLGPLTVHYWIADALMALFFLLVGLEVKREWYEGQRARRGARAVATLAGVGRRWRS